MLSLSGICDIREFVPDYHNDTIYFNNPVEFIANENDPRRLAALHNQDIVLAIGRDDRLFGTNQAMSDVLWKGNLARVSAVGRLVARLALLAENDAPVHLRA